MARAYDLAVIGGGSAGFNAARVAADLGLRVAVFDGARKLSGLCILRGCMPSKTLIYSAEVLHLAKTAADFGLKVPRAFPDMKAVQARKRRIIGGFASYRARQLTQGRFDLVRGMAHFADSHTVETPDGRRISADHFLIGTGSRIATPPIPGLAQTPHWTSDEVLDLGALPKSLLVLGGGIVACELAQYLARMGVRVSLVQRSPHLLRANSEEAAAVIRRVFEDEGIEVITGTRLVAVRRDRGGVTVEFTRAGRTHTRRADRLMNALGREPETSGLGLAAAGVRTAPNGRILANRWQQTSAPHIYAAGDCCGPHEIVHVAIQQAELAVRHLAGVRGLRPLSDATLLNVVFTDPQIGTMGWTERDLKKQGVRYLASSYPFDDHGRSILMNATYGHVRVFAEPLRGRILGAEIVGKDAGELIHSFTAPISMGATVHDMLRAPWYHPTLSEIVTYPLEAIAEKLPKRG